MIKTRQQQSLHKKSWFCCWLLDVCLFFGGSCLKNKTKSVWVKHWIIKKVRVSVCLQFVLFSLPQIWGVQYKHESHVSPTWPGRLKVKSSRRAELISPPQTGNLMLVPLSCLHGIQRLKQISSWFKVGSACAAVLWPVFMFCFSSMLMTVKPQQPPAFIRQVLTQLLFTQAHNKSTTFLGREIRTHQEGDNGERLSLGLFRFSLVARLDDTSVCTEGATTECFSRFVLCYDVFWLWILGKMQAINTSCMLNNPLSQLLSLITNYSNRMSPGNILCTSDTEIRLNPNNHFQIAATHPSTNYLQKEGSM